MQAVAFGMVTGSAVEQAFNCGAAVVPANHHQTFILTVQWPPRAGHRLQPPVPVSPIMPQLTRLSPLLVQTGPLL